MPRKTILRALSFVAALASPSATSAQAPPFPKLLVAVEPQSSGVLYRYRLVHSPTSVDLPDIGVLTVGGGESSYGDEPALKQVPAAVGSPDGWPAGIVMWEHAAGVQVEWTGRDNPLSTGSDLCGFEILMPQATDALRNGPFSLGLLRGASTVSLLISEVSPQELGCPAGSPLPVVQARYGRSGFGKVELGKSVTWPLVYYNRSGIAVSVSLSIEGSSFALVGPSTLAIGPNGEGAVPVRFSPTAVGKADGKIRLTGAIGGDATLVGEGVPPSQPVPEPVVWTSAVGVTVSGNNLTKTSSGWGNAGAVSTKSLVSGDGYVEVTASATTSGAAFGLSKGDSNQDLSDIDFGLRMSAGRLIVYEGGKWRAFMGPYFPGDKLQVAVEGGSVVYKRNGVVLYTSWAATYPLLVDTALEEQGATLDSVVVFGNWQ